MILKQHKHNMALPTNDDLLTMDYVYEGTPFVYVPANTGVDLYTMDYVYQGIPFVVNSGGSAPPSAHKIKTINFTLLTGIKAINGVPVASLKTFGGVSDV